MQLVNGLKVANLKTNRPIHTHAMAESEAKVEKPDKRTRPKNMAELKTLKKLRRERFADRLRVQKEQQ